MLDYGASEWRLQGYEALRNHPRLLAWWFRRWTAANLEAPRESWRELPTSGVLGAAAADEHLPGLAEVGRNLRARADAAELVERAMTGELFVPPL